MSACCEGFDVGPVLFFRPAAVTVSYTLLTGNISILRAVIRNSEIMSILQVISLRPSWAYEGNVWIKPKTPLLLLDVFERCTRMMYLFRHACIYMYKPTYCCPPPFGVYLLNLYFGIMCLSIYFPWCRNVSCGSYKWCPSVETSSKFPEFFSCSVMFLHSPSLSISPLSASYLICRV